MKHLLRMSLFIIARTGLCLAVVAWIVGQWHEVSCSGGALYAVICTRGYYVGHFNETLGWSYDSKPWSYYDDSVSDRSFFEAPGDSEVQYLTKLFPGVSYLRFYGKCFSFRHWLIVTIFALFYGVLKIIYRRKPHKGESDA